MPDSKEMQYFRVLKRISTYTEPDKLRRSAEKQYGLSGDEAIEMAYDNVLNEARLAVKGKRKPKG